MSEPIMSPDGNFMWTGSEWIPAPPTNQTSQSMNMQDSAVAGDFNASSPNSGQSMNMQDSVVAGDVNIVQNIGVDGNSVVSMMIAELEKLDHNKSGIHIPQGGLSTSVILAGIDEIKQNLGNLNRFSTEHLLELCTALLSIGHPDLMIIAGKIILDRARTEGNRKQEAKAHLFIADGHEMNIEINEAVFHAQESLKIAKEIGDISIETEALFTTCNLLESSCKSSDNFIPRIEELLGDASSLGHSHLAYLLSAKSIVVKYNNQLFAEELQKEAYSYAKLDGDLKLQVTTGLMMVGNDVHKIDKSELMEIHRQCSLNNLPFFNLMLGFAIRMAGDEQSGEQTIEAIQRLSTEGETICVPLFIHMGDLYTKMTNFYDAFGSDDVIGELGKIFEEPKFTSAIRKAVDNEYFELVDELLFIFAITRISGYTNETIQSLAKANREVMGSDIQLYLQIISSIERTYSLAETHQLCRDLNTDSVDIAENKSTLRTFLSMSPLSTGAPPNYSAAMPMNPPSGIPMSSPPGYPPMPMSPPPGYPPMPMSPPPGAPMPMPKSPPPGAPIPMPQVPGLTPKPPINFLEKMMVIKQNAENDNWSAVISDANVILANRNQLEQDTEDKWMIAESLTYRGLAYYHIGNFNAAIADLEEAVNRKKFAGDFDNAHFENLISIAKQSGNGAGNEHVAKEKSGFGGGFTILLICLVIGRIVLYSLK